MRIKKESFAIGIIWLFHLSAIIGIYLGYQDWFLPKTPLNLVLSFGLLIWVGNLLNAKRAFIAYIFFVSGMFVEWLGVKFGWPFGEYVYGDNLGLKLDGVPYLIGINWSMLVLITGAISTRISSNFFFKALIGASLMVGLDFFIEPSASIFDFWYWEGDHIPLSNYIAWFVVAFLLHLLYQKTIKSFHFDFSLHLYLAQLTFFISFYVYSNF